MMRTNIEQLTALEIEDLGKAFSDAQASRALVEGAETASGSARGQIVQQLRAALSSGSSIRGVLQAIDGPIPIGLVALARDSLARESRAGSLLAHAASTSDTVRRDIGDSQLSLVEEDDVTFIVIELGDTLKTEPPQLLTVLCHDGSIIEIDLPDPIEAAIQVGIAKSSDAYSSHVPALKRPDNSIFLN